MKTMEQFRSELIANKELAEKLIKTTNEQELEAFLKENDVDCTKEQFGEFLLAKAKKSGELSDEELEGVTGGRSLLGKGAAKTGDNMLLELLKLLFGSQININFKTIF